MIKKLIFLILLLIPAICSAANNCSTTPPTGYIVCEDFETGPFTQISGSNYYYLSGEYHFPSGGELEAVTYHDMASPNFGPVESSEANRNTISTAQAKSGTHSYKFQKRTDDTSGKDLDISLGTYYQDVYVRYWVYFPSGWALGSGGYLVPAHFLFFQTQNHMYVGLDVMWNYRTINNSGDAYKATAHDTIISLHGYAAGRVEGGGYNSDDSKGACKDVGTLGNCWDAYNTTDSYADVGNHLEGKWISVEVRANNTAHTMELWVYEDADTVYYAPSVASEIDWSLIGWYDSGFNKVVLSNYRWDPTYASIYYVDDVVVGTQRMGNPFSGSDTTPPVVTISTSDPSNVTVNSLSISGTASDAVGVTQCKYRIGSAPDGSNGTIITGTTSWSGTATGFSVGANTLYVGCTDAAGNWGNDSIVVNYNPPPAQGKGFTITGGQVR